MGPCVPATWENVKNLLKATYNLLFRSWVVSVFKVLKVSDPEIWGHLQEARSDPIPRAWICAVNRNAAEKFCALRFLLGFSAKHTKKDVRLVVS
jgi:hypothetical protein